ncbi:hypothetical protein [Methyloceanibacter caenitepidi]|uniref:Uncharacterized protein n=1 Tax=Methyloceanibacter caenitepidi TaxID=1384459 RepID=A0A0A8K098_9HYPH|nr:hypothetical protein [Methyloceanibacter caenitepidi]BAQ15922.1 hypothetical protein GL4_0455 [Methyloceanibacter caenitepidi]
MPKTPADEKTQIQKFKDAAKEVGCNDDEAAFDAALRKIGNAQPPTASKPKPKKTKTPAK